MAHFTSSKRRPTTAVVADARARKWVDASSRGNNMLFRSCDILRGASEPRYSRPHESCPARMQLSLAHDFPRYGRDLEVRRAWLYATRLPFAWLPFFRRASSQFPDRATHIPHHPVPEGAGERSPCI